MHGARKKSASPFGHQALLYDLSFNLFGGFFMIYVFSLMAFGKLMIL